MFVATPYRIKYIINSSDLMTYITNTGLNNPTFKMGLFNSVFYIFYPIFLSDVPNKDLIIYFYVTLN